MELDDILNMQRLQCTGDVARAGWVLDQDAILEAMDQLNIKMPVHIRYMTGRYTRGTHRETLTHHKITMDQTRPIEDANFTLWHELVHCWQAEEFVRVYKRPITQFHTAYKLARGDHGQSYLGNTYELEANRIAAQNEQTYLLAKAS